MIVTSTRGKKDMNNFSLPFDEIGSHYLGFLFIIKLRRNTLMFCEINFSE